MNEFNDKARAWDLNPMHRQRSEAVASAIEDSIQLTGEMTALEFGAGTGTTGFLLSDKLAHITMVDSSEGMIEIIKEKISQKRAANLEAICLDLEHNDLEGRKFNLIFSQMTLHHVKDIPLIISKFRSILTSGGYLAIADIYKEDGSFHGEGADVHKGFDPEELSLILNSIGFLDISHRTCFTIEKSTTTGLQNFDVFLITARKR